MLFRRKIDDPLRANQLIPTGDKHLADLDFASFAGNRVLLEVFGERFFKHQGNSLAHHTDFIDRVNQRLDVGIKQVAFSK